MKHLYTALAALFISLSAAAQLPDGSIAPDFTAEDIYGVEHNLYDLLDQGKKVLLDFSATWCAPCWGYHESGAFKEVWETYGPDGTDEVYVLFIETDDDTDMDDLQGLTAGQAGGSQGNWLEGTDYPIIDNGGAIADAYEILFIPTVYVVCPSRLIKETAPVAANQLADLLFSNDCAAASQDNDAAMLNYTGETITCGGNPSAISARMINMGLENLTSATLDLVVDGNSVMSHNWTGNLETYNIEEVQMGSYSFNGSTDFSIRVNIGDNNPSNDEAMGSIEGAAPSTSLFYIYIETDGWGEETGWEIRDNDGDIVASVAPGTYANTSTYEEYVGVPSTGCYSFTLIDTYGDGLHGSQWGSIDGACYVTTVDNNLNTFSWVYANNGSYDMESESSAAEVQTAVNVEEEGTTTTFNVYPNPVEDVAWIDLSLAGNEEVRLDVVNLIGQKVVSQDLGTLSAGQTRMPLDLGSLQSGIYLVTVTAGDTVSTLRVTKK